MTDINEKSQTPTCGLVESELVMSSDWGMCGVIVTAGLSSSRWGTWGVSGFVFSGRRDKSGSDCDPLSWLNVIPVGFGDSSAFAGSFDTSGDGIRNDCDDRFGVLGKLGMRGMVGAFGEGGGVWRRIWEARLGEPKWNGEAWGEYRAGSYFLSVVLSALIKIGLSLCFAFFSSSGGGLSACGGGLSSWWSSSGSWFSSFWNGSF